MIQQDPPGNVFSLIAGGAVTLATVWLAIWIVIIEPIVKRWRRR